MNNEQILNDFKQYTKKCVENFNNGDIQECIDGYVDDAIMVVANVGEFKGKEAIASFWSELTKTANFLEYINPQYKVIDKDTVHLSSDWRMNIGEGIITLEEWKKQEDGSWKLTDDRFEVLKQY
jgi:ketosteroid isomerase-like protein